MYSRQVNQYRREDSSLKCSVCDGKDEAAFIIIGDKSICVACVAKSKTSGETVKAEVSTQFFTQYICRVHNCGTCNPNQMNRHYIAGVCDVYTKSIPNWHKPKTFGGYNGDINRRYYTTPKDVHIKLMSRWKQTIKEIRKKHNLDPHGGGRNGFVNRRRKAGGHRRQRS